MVVVTPTSFVTPPSCGALPTRLLLANLADEVVCFVSFRDRTDFQPP
jgi:hypothetical protein